MRNEATVERDAAARGMVRDVERALARCWAKLYGHGPSKIDLGMRGDHVVLSFGGGLSPSDRFLIEKGCGDLDDNDDRAAVPAWSEQARRKSRDLGDESRRLGADNEAARRRFEELRRLHS